MCRLICTGDVCVGHYDPFSRCLKYTHSVPKMSDFHFDLSSSSIFYVLHLVM